MMIIKAGGSGLTDAMYVKALCNGRSASVLTLTCPMYLTYCLLLNPYMLSSPSTKILVLKLFPFVISDIGYNYIGSF